MSGPKLIELRRMRAALERQRNHDRCAAFGSEYARLLQELIADSRTPFEIECVDRMSQALARLDAGGIRLILSDLTLPDSQGLETFNTLHAHAPQTPIIVLSGLDDEALAVETVEKGAQDYLVKGTFDTNLLARAITSR